MKNIFSLTEGAANTSWGWSDFYTYVLLKPGTNAKALEAKFPAFAERYMGTDMKERAYENYFYLQPLKDIHLRSKYDYEMAGNGNLTYLKYLGHRCVVHSFYCMDQLCKSFHGTFTGSFERSRNKKSCWCRKVSTHSPVYYRVAFH